MSRQAWLYVSSVLLAALGAGLLALTTRDPANVPWTLGLFLLVSTAVAQLVKVEGPNHQLYHASPIFFFASVLLLPPPWLVLVICVAHLVEWIKERATHSPHLRAWYLQPFNTAMFILTTLTSQLTYSLLSATLDRLFPSALVLAVVAAAVIYVVVNNVINGCALWFARGVSFRDSQALGLQTLGPELILLLLGAVVARLWHLSPTYVPLALSPIVLMYRALLIPKLKQDAQVDGKTGVLNAQYINLAIASELERAMRFNRPLTVVMADLDLLREINNTYGHLAGDAVLAGIGTIIREHIREYDIAGRFGGEEFTLILPETDLDAARPVVQRIRQAIAAHPFTVATSDTPIHATMSFGLAAFPTHGATVKALVHNADLAVYEAKRRGRNCVVTASELAAEPDLLDKFDGRASIVEPEGVAVPIPVPPPSMLQTRPMTQPATPGTLPTPASAVPPPPKEQPSPQANRELPWFAWLYLLVLLSGAGIMSALSLHQGVPAPSSWLLFAALLVVGTVTQAHQADGADHVLFHATPVFLFAGVMTLPPSLMLLLVVVPHLVEWVRAWWRKSAHLQRWYLQPFNIAKYIVAGILSSEILINLAPHVEVLEVGSLLLGLGIPLVYLGLDRLILNSILILSGRISWHDRPALTKGMLTEYLLLLLGYLLAMITHYEPWLAPLVLAPLVVMQQALQLPKVQVDSVRKVHQANQELQQANQAIRHLNDDLFLTLAKIFDARDPYVGGHASQVAAYAVAIATELGLPSERIDLIRQAGYLHDIGKMAIPETILHKPAKLTDDEFAIMKTHAAIGAEFLETSQGLRHLAPFVRHHHERWDGRGYPAGLAGDAIPLEARILSVCDAVEAMAADRPYHTGMSVDEIMTEVRRCRGSQFDPAIAEIFLRIAEREREQFIVNSANEVQRKYHSKTETIFGRNIQLLAGVYQGVQ